MFEMDDFPSRHNEHIWKNQLDFHRRTSNRDDKFPSMDCILKSKKPRNRRRSSPFHRRYLTDLLKFFFRSVIERCRTDSEEKEYSK